VPDEMVGRGLSRLLPVNAAGIATGSTQVTQVTEET